MHIFYTPDIAQDSYTLPEEESKHCARVLRLKKDDTIYLIDGKGSFYTALITEANPKRCSVKITDIKKEYGKRNFYLHIAIAPTKNTERFEWFLEKATEIGIDEITPLICEHSERTNLKTERLTKILISAIKQSLKAYLPKLNEPQKFKELIKQEFKGQKFIAHCGQALSPALQKTTNIIPALSHLYKSNTDALILIGPEGDFSPNEIMASLEKDFSEISLGTSRLRTETAGIVACHTIHLINEE